MVRRYSNSFRPAWAVNVPAQNSKQSETEALSTKPVEKAKTPSDDDDVQARGKLGKYRDEIYPAVTLGLPSQEVKTGGRSYSKVFPSSWSLPSEAKTPPTNIIDYGNPAYSMDVPEAPQNFSTGPGPQSYSRRQKSPSFLLDQPIYRFSAESGEGDAAPRPPEGYKAETYPTPWDHRNRIPSSESGNASHNIPDPPMAASPPWGSSNKDISRQITSYLPYRESSTSAKTTSSGSVDVPARAPPVSSTYSSIIENN